MSTYLIAHTDHAGKNTAQFQVEAKNETEAKKVFAFVLPERVISTVGTR